jgi:secreted trypsin-like serine protease
VTRAVLWALAVLAMVAAPASATYGGRAASSGEAAFTAYFTVLEGNTISECSGALVNRRYVLTAAHCVRPERPGGRVVTVGRAVRVGNPGRRARLARVLRVSVHPRYRVTDTRAGYDLAILTLAKPLGTGVAVATAEEERSLAAPPSQATAIGFGINRVGQPVRPRRARTARLEMLSPFNCVTPGLVEAFQRSQVCAASGSAGICAGDSGGPLVVTAPDGRRRLVGITSLAIEEVPCRNVVGVFTRVAALRQWVMSRMGRTATSQPPPPPPAS